MRRRAMATTTGVLPVPPTDKLPTLITGRASRRRAAGCEAYHRRRASATELKRWLARLKRGCGTPISGRGPEGHDYAVIASLDRQQLGDRSQTAIAGAAIGFHKCASGGAKARAADRIGEQAHERVLELTS